LVCEVAEGALTGKAESRNRKAEGTAVSCPPQLPVPCALISHFSFQLSRFQHLSLLSALRFQLSAFQLFASWPVEQYALGPLLAGCDFDQAPNEIGSNLRSALFHFAVRPTSGLTHSHDADFNQPCFLK
jgi:hypothetical protein